MNNDPRRELAKTMRDAGIPVAKIAETIGAPLSTTYWWSGVRREAIPPEAAADVIALRRRGVSFRDIQIALEHFRGVSVTDGQLRYLCSVARCPTRREARAA